MKAEDYLKSFEKLKEQQKIEQDNFEEREFYSLVEDIKYDISILSDIIFDHPKYDFKPTKEIPESIECDLMEKLVKEIEMHVKESKPFDEEEISDYMFSNRHDDDFDEDSMNYDSVFGKD